MSVFRSQLFDDDPPKYPLDHPSASAKFAYSIGSKLSSSWGGNAILARRSDGATRAIGFVEDETDVDDLESWASGFDAFLVTAYDQTGNGRDITQPTNAMQGTIHSASTGAILGANGRLVAGLNGAVPQWYSNASNGFSSGDIAITVVADYRADAAAGQCVWSLYGGGGSTTSVRGAASISTSEIALALTGAVPNPGPRYEPLSGNIASPTFAVWRKPASAQIGNAIVRSAGSLTALSSDVDPTYSMNLGSAADTFWGILDIGGSQFAPLTGTIGTLMAWEAEIPDDELYDIEERMKQIRG